MSIGIALTEDKLAMDKCVKCLRCYLVCPLTEAQGIAAETFVQAYRMCTTSGDDFRALTELCLDCGRCVMACPSNIPVPAVVLSVRSELRRKYGPSASDRFLERSPGFSRVGAAVPFAANFALRNSVVRSALQGAAGISARHKLPPLRRGRPLRRRASGPAVGPGAGPRVGPAFGPVAGRLDRKVWYFTGCAVDYMDEQGVGEATAAILDRAGFDWDVAPHTCCGIVKILHGNVGGAKRDAARNLDYLAPLAEQGGLIVTSCPTCGLALRENYPRLLETAAARSVAAATVDLFELLDLAGEKGALPPTSVGAAKAAAYHHPCHLAAQGVSRQNVLRVLERVGGLTLSNIEDGCCGSGGTDGFKKDKFDVSVMAGSPLAEEIRGSGSSLVITSCLACQLQLSQNCHLEAVHPAVVLAGALGKAR